MAVAETITLGKVILLMFGLIGVDPNGYKNWILIGQSPAPISMGECYTQAKEVNDAQTSYTIGETLLASCAPAAEQAEPEINPNTEPFVSLPPMKWTGDDY